MRKSILVAVLVVSVLAIGFTVGEQLVLATEIRVVPNDVSNSDGTVCDPDGAVDSAYGGTSACDLVRAAAGLPLVAGPDQGVTPQNGDYLVLEPGIYTLIPDTGGAPR